MKRLLILFLCCFSLLSMMPPAKTHVLFFGDSITEMGMKPGGYIQLIQRWLDSTGKSSGFQLTGAGVGANKVYDLYLRLDSDVIAKKTGCCFGFYWCE